jgi:hypothetical protein
MFRCGKQGIKTAANHLTRGDTGAEIQLPDDAPAFPRHSDRSTPKVAKKLCAIVLLGR